MFLRIILFNMKMYKHKCANIIHSHRCQIFGVVKPSHWGRQSVGRDGWQNDSSARGINARVPERQESRASHALRVYTAARLDMPRVFWVGHQEKSLNRSSEYWQGDNRTVWGDIYSLSKWRGKLRWFFFFFFLSKVYFIINSKCFVKSILYTMRLCEMGMWSCIAASCSAATGVSCWTCMHGYRSVLLITPAYSS